MRCRRVLLKDIRPPAHFNHPGLDHGFQDLDVVISSHPKVLGEEGGMMSPSLNTTLRTITEVENFVDITMGTSSGSSVMKRLFCQLWSLSWINFFSSEKNLTWPDDPCFSLLNMAVPLINHCSIRAAVNK